MKKMRSIIAVLAVAAAALAAFSCKKKSEETIPSLAGGIYSEVPPYVERGDAFTVKASGIYTAEGETVTYQITVDSVQTSYVTFDPEAGFVVQLGTDEEKFPNGGYYVFIMASAEGYYSSSASFRFNIIEPGVTGEGSLTGLGIDPSDPNKIEVDDQDYYFKPIGDREWLRHNLAVTEPQSEYSGEGIFGGVYANCPVMGEVLGRSYTYEEALAACPSGWRLPTEEDWAALAVACGAEDKTYETGEIFKGIAGPLKAKASLNGAELWEFWPKSAATDEFGFAALPSGWSERRPGGDGQTDSFSDIMKYAVFWTATEYDSDCAWYRFITDIDPDMHADVGHKDSFGASVRCVRDVSEP